MKRTYVNLPDDLWRRAKAVAKRRGLGLSTYVMLAVDARIDADEAKEREKGKTDEEE